MNFYDYVFNKNTWELESEVGEIYQKFKGKSNMIPCFGYFNCIWLSEALLLYKYLDKINSKYKLTLAHNVIIPAYHGVSVPLFLALMDVFLKQSGMANEWKDVHAYIESLECLYDFEFASETTPKSIENRTKMNQILQRNTTTPAKNQVDFLKYSLSLGLYVPTIYD